MEKPDITTYEGAVEYLLAIPKFTSKHSLEQTREFLHKLGDPDLDLRILHVAGTNGKGSVCAYMRSILEASGKRVCVFTSPHLVDIRERFLLMGKLPSREQFLESFRAVLERLDWEAIREGEGYHPTFFEYLFFMAMLLFRDAGPDYCILETGLGGRLDATNSVGRKELTVITRIALDHVEYLGNTIAAIAAEKAGILRAGVPNVFADVEPQATAVLTQRARELQIPSCPVSKEDYTNLKFHQKTIDFLFRYRYHKNIGIHLSTIAHYQVENASLAIRAVQVLWERERGGFAGQDGQKAEEQRIRWIQEGVSKCFWAGRMEEILPEVYVDGAHNADGIRAFLETVEGDGRGGARLLLFSAVSDKDYGQMLEQIVGSGLFSHIAIVRMKGGRALCLERLKETLARLGCASFTCYEETQTALAELLKMQGSARLYIAGSLYLTGEIKACLEDRMEGASSDPG